MGSFCIKNIKGATVYAHPETKIDIQIKHIINKKPLICGIGVFYILFIARQFIIENKNNIYSNH